MDRGAERVLESLRCVGSEVNRDGYAGSYAGCYLDVQHHFAIRALRGRGMIAAVVDRDGLHGGRRQSQALEVLCDVSRTVAAVQLDQADGLSGHIHSLGKAVKFANLGWIERLARGTCPKDPVRDVIPEMRMCNRPVIEPEDS